MNAAKITLPGKHEWIGVPSTAAMSTPEWYDDAPEVGEWRLPNLEVILWLSGSGQQKLDVENSSIISGCVVEYLNVKIEAKVRIIVIMT